MESIFPLMKCLDGKLEMTSLPLFNVQQMNTSNMVGFSRHKQPSSNAALAGRYIV